MITIKAAINDLKQTARFASDAIRAINTGRDSRAGVAEEAARRLTASADLVERMEAEQAPVTRATPSEQVPAGAFAYLECRPCIRFVSPIGGEHIESFRSEEDFTAAIEQARKDGAFGGAFWTLYGVSTESQALGDFGDKAAAYAAMNGFLAFLGGVRHMIEEGEDREIRPGEFIGSAERAVDMIADFILQSSDKERI